MAKFIKQYRYEDISRWIIPLVKLQESRKRFVTVEEAREMWGMQSRSGAERRLKYLVSENLAEKIKIGNLYHYHIVEVKK